MPTDFTTGETLTAARLKEWTDVVNANTLKVEKVSESVFDANNYAFTPQAPGGSLTAATPATVTLTPVPYGVAGANVGHYLWISGGTGTAEAVLITGGTATSGATTGTVTFTPANNHSGAWTVAPASGGIQEAINAAPAWGVIHIISPPDTQYAFELKAKVTIPKSLTLEGNAGGGLTAYRSASYPNGDLFYTLAGLYYVAIRNMGVMTIEGNGHTTGAAFRFLAGNKVRMEDVSIGQGQFGIVLDGTGEAHLDRVIYQNGDMTFQGLYGIYLTGGAINTYIADSMFYGYPATDANLLYAGIGIGEADGVWVSNSGFSGGYGINISLENATGFVGNVQFVGCQVDTVGKSAVRIYGSAKLGGGIKFVGCHFHSQGGNGGPATEPVVSIGYGASATVDNLQMDSCYIQGGGIMGVYVRATSAKHISFTGNRISGNNISDTAAQAGFYVYTGMSGLVLTGNTIGNDTLGHQKYGIVLGGTIADSVIVGNKLTNNETGGMLSSSPPTAYSNVVIENNLGVSDVVGSVAAGATVVLPFNPVVKITGTTAAIATLNGGWTGRKAKLLFTDASPDGVTTGGNILRAKTVVQNEAIELTFDGTNWY